MLRVALKMDKEPRGAWRSGAFLLLQDSLYLAYLYKF